jgi:cytochrome b6-f complex iron-sulfur subunit
VETTSDSAEFKMRRRIVWGTVAGSLTVFFLMFVRFFLPRSILEPSSIFRIGSPNDYALGVDTKWQQQYRIWVTRTSDRLFVIYARCTHLGCTPDWKASENKFKCPCHGSGYYKSGVNFEGPTPRPLERAHIFISPDDGQIVVDKSQKFQYELGQWEDPNAFIPAA